MKHCIAIVCSVAIVVGLAGCNPKAEPDNSAIEAARKDAAAVSNQLTEASMKLNHFEQMVKVLELEVTNLTHTVHEYSNKVVELRAHLTEQQRQLIAAQAEAPKRDVRILELESKLQEQALQMERLRAQLAEGNSRVPALEQQLAALEEQKSHWQSEMTRLKYERDELLGLWDDPKALEARLNQVDPRRAKKASSAVSKNSRLSLTPHGGVKVNSSPVNSGRKPQEKKAVEKTAG